MYALAVLSYLTNRLELFIVVIITCQQKTSIFSCSFTSAYVPPNDNDIKSVPYTFYVVFLQLKHKHQLQNLEKVDRRTSSIRLHKRSVLIRFLNKTAVLIKCSHSYKLHRMFLKAYLQPAMRSFSNFISGINIQ